MGGFERFVEDQADRLLRLAFLLTGDQHDAEDLAQDALVRIRSRWARVSAADNVGAYARRVLINCYLSAARQKSVDTVSFRPDLITDVRRDHADLVAQRDEVRRALMRLPIRQRTVVVLRYYEDLDTERIGSLMGISASSARSALSRAMAALEGGLRPEVDSKGGRDAAVRD